MQIIAGALRGRSLIAPGGDATRPTSARTRQALFDMLAHAPWAGRGLLDGALVLDGFAGTGALGLEALSRGAAEAVFIERDQAALAALRANIAACKAGDRARVVPTDIRRPPPGSPRTVAFLDPPYGLDLLGAAVVALRHSGWIDTATIIVAETGRNEVLSPGGHLLAQRSHGAARLLVWRET